MHVVFLQPDWFWDCNLQKSFTSCRPEKVTLDPLDSGEDLAHTYFWLQESHRPEWAHASHPLRMTFYHSLTPCTTVACASAGNAAGGRWECAAEGCHRGEDRDSTACVHSLPKMKESPAIKSAAVLFLLWLFAFRQQHIYWLFIGCEHSEQKLCGPGARSAVVCGPWLS